MANGDRRDGTINLTPYQKGQSGNPAGKPKGAKNRSSLAKKWLTATEKARNPITQEIEDLTQEDIMMLSMIKAVRVNQDVKAFEMLMDMRFGKQASPAVKSPTPEASSPEAYSPFEIVDPQYGDAKIKIEIGAAIKKTV